MTFTLAHRTDVGDEYDSEERTDSISVSDGTARSRRSKRSLSPAKKRVLDMLAHGLAEKEMAERLHLSQHTVHNHIKGIYQIFEVHSRAELLAKLLSGRR